eukprot:CFRG1976T1
MSQSQSQAQLPDSLPDLTNPAVWATESESSFKAPSVNRAKLGMMQMGMTPEIMSSELSMESQMLEQMENKIDKELKNLEIEKEVLKRLQNQLVRVEYEKDLKDEKSSS